MQSISRVQLPAGQAAAKAAARPVAPKAPRNVAQQAVRDVFMPALSSTMTEVRRGGARSARPARR